MASSGPLEKVSISDFEAKTILGRGRFGRVYQVQRKGTKEHYAVKVVVKEEVMESRIRNQLINEIELQSCVDQEYILRLKMQSEDTKYVYLFMDVAECGNLYDYMRILRQLPEFLAKKYIKQLLSALVYLHNKNIIHRDIKPENLMLSREGNLLLGDFGWSTYLDRDGVERLTICGTPEYIPPEMINNLPHNASVDSWAVGILCFELLVGCTPFKGLSQEDTFSNIISGEFDIPPTLSESVTDFLLFAVVVDGNKRHSSVQLYANDWIQSLSDVENEVSIVDYCRNYEARHRSVGSSDGDDIMDQILRQCELQSTITPSNSGNYASNSHVVASSSISNFGCISDEVKEENDEDGKKSNSHNISATITNSGVETTPLEKNKNENKSYDKSGYSQRKTSVSKRKIISSTKTNDVDKDSFKIASKEDVENAITQAQAETVTNLTKRNSQSIPLPLSERSSSSSNIISNNNSRISTNNKSDIDRTTRSNNGRDKKSSSSNSIEQDTYSGVKRQQLGALYSRPSARSRVHL